MTIESTIKFNFPAHTYYKKWTLLACVAGLIRRVPMIPIEYYQAAATKIIWRDAQPYWNGTYKNKLAGRVNKEGYRVIGITVNGKQKQLRAHRLHWFMVYGTLPDMLDHINRDKTDNRIENLRITNTQLNGYNSNNKPSMYSHYRGVTYRKSRRQWIARLHVKDKVYSKVTKTETEAAVAYNELVIKHGLQDYIALNHVDRGGT